MKRKFSALKAFGKGLIPAVSAFIVGQLAVADVGGILANPQEQLPVLGMSLAAGLVPTLINTWKHRHDVGNPFYVGPAIVLIAVALAGGLSACKTTTLPDGTTIQEWDLDSIQSAYILYLTEKAMLDAEDAREDAAKEAERQARLRELNAILEPLAATLRARGVEAVRDLEGRTFTVPSL